MVEFQDICDHCGQPIFKGEDRIIRGERLVLDPTRGMVFVDGAAIRTTRREFDVLYLLASKEPSVVSKDAIFLVVWGDSDVETKIIDVFVCKLRKKMNAISDGSGSLLETIWGRGYSLKIS